MSEAMFSRQREDELDHLENQPRHYPDAVITEDGVRFAGMLTDGTPFVIHTTHGIEGWKLFDVCLQHVAERMDMTMEDAMSAMAAVVFGT